ncbi:MAG: DUF4142 domain-containing protein [Cypionkella sp.]
MKYLLLAAAPAAALALAACSPAADDNDAAPAAESTAGQAADDTAAMAPAEGTDGEAAASAQGFVDQASASDMFEIESGKLAQSMGKSEEVKQFGAMMVQDHTKSSAELKAAAGKAEGVKLAPKLTAKQQSDLDALKKAGENFDATYKTQQVAAHTATLELLTGFAANGDVQSLKDFAKKTAPVVEKHLAEARRLP